MLEHVKRQCPAVEHLVVEGADVELVAERFLRAGAELEDLELADLVGQSLAGPGDVAVDLGLDAGLVDVRVVVEVVDHLLAGPALGVDAGVDDEADGAPDVGLEAAIVGVRILVEADILAQPLGVEAPTFDEGGVAAVLAELGNALKLLRDGNLQVMAGNALVVGDGLNVSRDCARWRCRC